MVISYCPDNILYIKVIETSIILLIDQVAAMIFEKVFDFRTSERIFYQVTKLFHEFELLLFNHESFFQDTKKLFFVSTIINIIPVYIALFYIPLLFCFVLVCFIFVCFVFSHAYVCFCFACL